MDNLKHAILENDPDTLISILLFESIPFIFKDSIELYRNWRKTLSHSIHVDPAEIIVIGSAAVGASLSPEKTLKPFDNKSDIDVAIISDKHFSEAWHYLRELDITLAQLTASQRNAIKDHRQRYVYWGCIATDRLLPILPFAPSWFDARSKLQDIDPTVGRDINFRIYKDYRALRSYQLQGLNRLRDALLDPQGE